MLIGVVFVVYTLAHFKYSAMLTDLWNYLFKDSKEPKSFVAPLGISFITFSAISYLADIYKGKAESGNLIDCLLYMTFFPKVVSGPIVLWRDFKEQIRSKDINFNNFVEGLNRLMIGFAKKLILADTFGACIASATGAIDIPTAFGVSILFMLQIYYDFSGYSDIAIGLSKMLGIGVKENFNFPYLSTSISDFWRRWHVSLGTWFREYVYIPLGGNRKGTKRTIINIAIVFLLTGIWHGAGWTYILWGAINGFCNIIEKLIADKKFYVKTPTVIKWVLTMAITFV
ncbi:MAG: MBOAT family O-acyltransferase, partial [Christensenellales bacterium]